MIEMPVVERCEMTCVDVDDQDMLVLITEDGETKEDLGLPKETHLQEVGRRIRQIVEEGEKECLVTFQKWGDREQVISVAEVDHPE